MFRVLWALGGGSPRVYHWALVLANAAAAVAATALVLPELSPLARVVAAFVYATHPVKSEAVNGAVGLAEVLSALLVFTAFGAATRGRPLVAASLCALAGLAKETGVMAVLVIAVYYYRQHKRAHRIKRTAVVLAVAAGLFVAARFYAFGTTPWSVEPAVEDNPMLRQRGFMWLLNAVIVQGLSFPLSFFVVP